MRQRLNGVFIAGTDTGIGKTVVSAALLWVLKSAGVDAVYMKPVQTGCLKKSGRLIAPDSEFVFSILGFFPPEKERRLIAPYCFRRACSPHLAAKLTRQTIRLSKIISSYKALKNRHDFVIIEGTGGVLTPLSRQYSMLDVMQSLSLPVILVTKPGLGTINHTLLSLRELKRANLKIMGMVFNYSSNKSKGIIEADNKTTIERLTRVPVLAEFPFLGQLRINGHARKTFQKTAQETLAGIRQPFAL